MRKYSQIPGENIHRRIFTNTRRKYLQIPGENILKYQERIFTGEYSQIPGENIHKYQERIFTNTGRIFRVSVIVPVTNELPRHIVIRLHPF